MICRFTGIDLIKVRSRCIEISRVIRAPRRKVWELITDTSRWSEWGPSVTAVDCADRFISKGSKGRIKTAVGVWVHFLITGFEEGLSWSWRVSGIPATGHRIEETGNGSCRLIFEVPLLAAPYLVVCKRALDRITEILER